MIPITDQGRSRRRWPWLSWRLSVASLLVPLVLLALSAAYVVWLENDAIELTVVDRVSGRPIAGALVEGEAASFTTDERGRTQVPAGTTLQRVRIVAPDHDAVVVELHPDQRRLRVALRPNVYRGQVRRNGDARPIAGVTVRAVRDGATLATVQTDPEGRFVLRGVAEGATLVFEHEDFASVELPVPPDRTELDVALRPDVLRGTVSAPDGQPVPATVAGTHGWTTCGADGTFRLKGVDVGDQVVVKAPGFRAVRLEVPETREVHVTLEPIVVRAIYINALVASKPEALEQRLALVDRTELNAVVIDLKDSTGRVYYDTQVKLAHEIGAVQPILDPRVLVAELKQRGIYSIARIVVFEDPILAEAKPEWAIRDRTTGGPWRTWNGLAWVNAYRQEVWQYNTALALEAANFGFDEIQLDYIRFPTDGPLRNADYGVPHTPENRTRALREFLQTVQEALRPTPAYLAADIFGLTVWELSDSGIGQNLETIVQVVDYVCPMLYPSHFWSGSLGFELPNDHPYEVMRWSLENGLARVPDMRAKFRPWLQDFSYGPGKRYGPEEVRAQIRAVYDAGLSSWMLWNADSVFQEAALEVESGG